MLPSRNVRNPFEPVVEIQNQVLRQAVPVAGTPFRLHYRSDRVPGRRAASSLRIHLTGVSVPAQVKRVLLEVTVAGRQFAETFQAAPNLSHTFSWDGLGDDGRAIQGGQPAKVRIGYVYPAAFPRPELTRWQEHISAIGAWDARLLGMGGWSLSIHHAYDPLGHVLYLGDGRRRDRVGVDVAGARDNGKNGLANDGSEVMIPAEDGSEIYILDAAGRHLRTLHALTGGVLHRFVYEAGQLAAIEDAAGNVTTIERDGSGKPTGIVAPYGQRTSLDLDPDGFLSAITNPAGEASRFNCADGGLLVAAAAADGSTYRFAYDEAGRLARRLDPSGGPTDFARTNTDHGFQVSRITALSREHTYLVERLPGGGRRQVNKCCGGTQTIDATGPDGTRTVNYPDGTVLRWTEQPDPRFGPQTSMLRSATVETPAGISATMRGDRSVQLADQHDSSRVATLTDRLEVNGRSYLTVFEMAERLLTFDTPEGRRSAVILDGRGRALEARMNNLLPTRFVYDEHGHLSAVRHGSETDERVLMLRYDSHGNLAEVIDPLGRSRQFEYDAAQRMRKRTTLDGRDILYDYDLRGNLTSITPPGRSKHSYEYTPANLIKRYIPPPLGAEDGSTTYTYDQDNQLAQIRRPDGTVLDLVYDEAGRLIVVTSANGQVRVSYEPSSNNPKTLTAGDGTTVLFQYDGFLITSSIWNGVVSGTVSYAYDNQFRIVGFRINDGPALVLTYDGDGLIVQAGELTLSRDRANGLVSETRLGKVTTKHECNGFGEPVSDSVLFDGQEIFSQHYTRDALGRITEQWVRLSDQVSTFAYGYDLAGRLTDVARDGTVVAHYEYDPNGNRLVCDGQNGRSAGMYDAQDRLVQYGDLVYRYTANGELLSKTSPEGTTTYRYDIFGNLTAVTPPDGTTIEYVVDATNRRIAKKVNGSVEKGWLYHDGLRPVAELDGQMQVASRFIYAAKTNVPDYLEREGRIYRIVSDQLGSPWLVVDAATGEAVQRMAYDEFGNVIEDTNPGFQPFGFAGGLYDPQTGLVRFGARDYDARAGRWTAKDPIGFAGGDTNLYGYVLGDPVNAIDPLGRQDELTTTSQTSGEPVLKSVARSLGAAAGGAAGAELGGPIGKAVGSGIGGNVAGKLYDFFAQPGGPPPLSRRLGTHLPPSMHCPSHHGSDDYSPAQTPPSWWEGRP